MGILDVKKVRRAGPESILNSIRQVSETYERLLLDFDQAPHCDLPAQVKDLSNDELNEAIYGSARIYGHYARIAESSSSLLKGLKRAVETFTAALSTQIYSAVPEKQRKSDLMQDTQYIEAKQVLEKLEYLIGKAEGERKNWSSIKDALSRCVELRKDASNVRRPKRPTPLRENSPARRFIPKEGKK